MEENDYTLEEMRAGYKTLKDALARQEIVNDRLMRETMKSKVRGIRSLTAAGYVCTVFVMVMAPLVFHYYPVINASWYFVAGTELLMLFCMVVSRRYNHNVQSTDLNSCDLLTFSKHVRKMKEDYSGWLKYGVTLAFVWGAWFCAEVWFHSTDPKMALPIIVGMIVGLVTGGVIGYRMNRRIVSTCDDIIAQIEGRRI